MFYDLDTSELGRDEFNPATFDPHTLEFRNNPYPVYQWFRRYQPVSRVLGEYSNYWVFRYQDIVSILNDPDPDLWSKRNPIPSKTPQLLPNSLFLSDPGDDPSHTHLRKTLQPIMKEALGDIEPFAETLAANLVSKIAAKERFDLIKDYAEVLPSAALAHVLGVPGALWSKSITPFIDDVVNANDPTVSLIEGVKGKGAMLALRQTYKALVKAGSLKGKVGIESSFSDGKVLAAMREQAENPDSGFTEDDMVANATSMSLAGYFSTAYLLSTGVTHLLERSETLNELRESSDPASMQNAIGEMLRFDSPIQVIDRYALKDTRIGDVEIQLGDKVSLVIGSGNRDDEVFSNAAEFELSRDTSNKLSFGDGIHRCLGAPMLERVAPIALKYLTRELPPFSLDGEPECQYDPYFRGYRSLPLKLN